ncbi:GNAT family N-acetyltransferase [Streptomyces clavuligerus]|uniref:Putative acetyltransferase n=1 Tax=Streptomyces clavuligerus TaxID=1901 RepID=E2PVW0_STRCL|nr:GNAT family N-acetyltransferase [Streptomyces clavuligerus]ANW17545.1 GCN5 family acetyltransferase [Streptomyces clavuligerus]AXU12090.1 GNAT family N-acetyltransferase [Streptomyces clavuligerus]EFG09950.1 Putative acetyltransferase [Streptomyces clavuligerus]MBY6301954.1 GNAT family N-acetyltransferase [Streptomyces clavuligerus]QCS04871.1 N-acetyltransferase [Streptomyces clavuligerus]
MTGPVIRTLSESDAHLFDSLPDPLGVGRALARATHRPEWKRVALRDGAVVARGAWWGGPDDTAPVLLNWLDVAEGEEEAGAELLRTAPHRVEYQLILPRGWREDPVTRAAGEARLRAARSAGMRVLVERYQYRWTPACGLPERPGRLVFRPEPDDEVILDVLRRVHSATLDAHALLDIAEGGLDRAARAELDYFHWCPSPREWWQLAHTPGGELVGLHIPAHNPSGPCVGFIGVVPEQRGHGYAYDLLAECTHHLAAEGAEFIAGATDQGNFPMAANFAKAGHPIVDERIHLVYEGDAEPRP